MNRILILALAVSAAAIFCGTRHAMGDDRVTWETVESWAREDAETYGLDSDYMLAVLWCESRGDPYARGAAGEVGPAQFHPQGVWWDTPYAEDWPLTYARWSLRAQVYAFSWSFAVGYGSHWSCA